MPHKHEPRDAFVDELERQIGREVRQRNRALEAGRGSLWPRWQTAVAVAALVLVSMGVGAGAVLAAYQAQGNERRDMLVASYQKRVELAQQRLAIAQEQLREAERKFSVGMASSPDKADAHKNVDEALAEVATIQLDLEEIRITGRAPLNDLSAPRVSGRDFVSDRLRVDLQTLELASEREDVGRINLQKRVDIGTVDPLEVTAAQGRLLELKAARDNLARKLDLRQRFLKGDSDAVETELRAQESDAEQRGKMIAAQIDLARKELERMTKRVDVGVAPAIDLAKAKLHLQQLETDQAKAELDMALVRRQLDQRRAK